jgi:hypothetical protein
MVSENIAAARQTLLAILNHTPEQNALSLIQARNIFHKEYSLREESLLLFDIHGHSVIPPVTAVVIQHGLSCGIMVLR